jgi:hypothetical protein
MNKKQYLYSNLFAWGIVFLLIGNYVFVWTISSQNSPGGNVVLESGATPAGSTGYIQFNDAGNLGADSNLFWDNTNKKTWYRDDESRRFVTHCWFKFARDSIRRNECRFGSGNQDKK